MRREAVTTAAAAALLLAYGCGDDVVDAPDRDAGIDAGAASSGSGSSASSASSSASSSGAASSASSTSSTSSASSASSSAGAPDAGACTPLVLGPFTLRAADGEQVLAASIFGEANGDELHVELFDATPGAYDLATGNDASYATCRHCVVAVVDPQRQTAQTYFQTRGVLTVGPGTQLDGAIDATLADVRLVEVAIDPVTFVSTPVPGGACFAVDAATVQVAEPPLPAAWTCAASYWGDHDCDCGCGALDYECPQDATVASCDFCLTCGLGSQCEARVDPANLAACRAEFVPPPAWTCPAAKYRDGAACDCDCGADDPDCDPATDCLD